MWGTEKKIKNYKLKKVGSFNESGYKPICARIHPERFQLYSFLTQCLHLPLMETEIQLTLINVWVQDTPSTGTSWADILYIPLCLYKSESYIKLGETWY